MKRAEQFCRALLDPAAVYAAPADVLADPDLSDGEKTEILRKWVYDVSEESVAEEEGMPSHPGVTLSEVLQALHQLVSEIDQTRRPPTKQGGIDRAALHKSPKED